MASEPLIRHVSDTAHWVAVYRAQESERPDALIRDPFAKKLAGERGYKIVESLSVQGKMTWPMVCRGSKSICPTCSSTRRISSPPTSRSAGWSGCRATWRTRRRESGWTPAAERSFLCVLERR